MIIEFSDRANVVSSFSTDKAFLRSQIDSIQPTQSTSQLQEAMSLAEAYAQTATLGDDQPGTIFGSEATAPPADVFVFTDGRVEDAEKIRLEKIDTNRLQIRNVGKRDDNVGIVAMGAVRDYDRPDLLELTAFVQNFGSAPRSVDIALYVNEKLVEVQTVTLAPNSDVPNHVTVETQPATKVSSAMTVAFRDIPCEGEAVIETVLRVDDALPADDRAWTLVPASRPIRILLVSDGPAVLDAYLEALSFEFVPMTGKEYESTDDVALLQGRRSLFDVVIFDRVSTSRLPLGNYFFWGAAPKMDEVKIGEPIKDQVIFNWDETHPILRYVGIETIEVAQWLHITPPTDAVSLIEGETSPVLSYWNRGGSQFLVNAFGLVVEDETGAPRENTPWMHTADFVVFLQNSIEFLSSSISTPQSVTVAPGQPVSLSLRKSASEVIVSRPDKVEETVSTSGGDILHYASTRTLGVYRVKDATEEQRFAVNLFNRVESHIQPVASLTLGSETVATQANAVEVNRPAWSYVLLAMLVMLSFEWWVYLKRVFV